MSERPQWVADRIADLVLEMVETRRLCDQLRDTGLSLTAQRDHDRAELARIRDGVQTIATNPLTPLNVREALQRLLATDRSDQP